MSTESNRARKMFEGSIKEALKKMKRADKEFVESEWVTYVFNTAHWLFDTPADQVSEDELLRVGSSLTGAYAYFGNKSAYARAERDVYEEKRDNLLARLTQELLDDKYKVTDARNTAKIEIDDAGINEEVAIKEMNKNDWENLMRATDKMISFIQTTLSIRKSEQFRSNQMQN